MIGVERKNVVIGEVNEKLIFVKTTLPWRSASLTYTAGSHR